MSYVPLNVPIFIAAFSGALSGMGASGRVPNDPIPANYNDLSLMASAYAQAFDLTWTATPVATTFEVELVQSLSEAAWQDRAPQTSIGPQSVAVATYVPMVRALIAATRAGETYLSGQGIVPPPVGGIVSVTASAPIASSGGANPNITIAAATGGAAGSMSAADKTKLDLYAATWAANTAATGAVAGLESAADKTKLDAIPESSYAVSSAVAALDIDWSLSQTYYKTIAANSVFTFSNLVSGKVIILELTAGAGNTAAFPAGIKWPGGVQPTQTSSGTDLYTFADINGTIFGYVTQAMA